MEAGKYGEKQIRVGKYPLVRGPGFRDSFTAQNHFVISG